MTTIRIQHLGELGTVAVVRHRIDVQHAEPESLIIEDRLAPGAAVTITLAAGEVVSVAEAAGQYPDGPAKEKAA